MGIGQFSCLKLVLPFLGIFEVSVEIWGLKLEIWTYLYVINHHAKARKRVYSDSFLNQMQLLKCWGVPAQSVHRTTATNASAALLWYICTLCREWSAPDTGSMYKARSGFHEKPKPRFQLFAIFPCPNEIHLFQNWTCVKPLNISVYTWVQCYIQLQDAVLHLGLRFSTVCVGHKDTRSLQPAFAHRNTTEWSFSVQPLHIPTEIAHQRWPSHSNTIFTAFLLKLNLVKLDLISPLVWILTALASASSSVLRCQRSPDTQIP